MYCQIAVIFIAQSPIPATFDTIPYRDLGAEFPRVASVHRDRY